MAGGGEREVDLRHDRLGQSGIQCVLHDADDLEGFMRDVEWRLLQSPQHDHLPERCAAVQACADEALVDQRDRLGAVHIGVGEHPARRQPNAERVHVVGIDMVEQHRFVVRRVALQLGGDAHAPERVQAAVQPRRRDARDGAYSRQQLLKERIPSRGLAVLLRRQRDAHASAPGRATRRGRRSPSPRTCAAARSIPRAARARARLPQPPAPCGPWPVARSPARLLSGLAHRTRQITSRRVERRNEPADHARGRREQKGEREHGGIHRDFRLIGNSAGRHQGEQRRQTRVTDRRTERSSGQCEDQALGEQLAHQPAPVGAECDAHDHLALPRAGSGQEKIRHVRTRDQQQQADRADEHPDVPGDRARERLRERQQTDTPLVGELTRLARLQIRDDRRQVRFRLRRPSRRVSAGRAGARPRRLR